MLKLNVKSLRYTVTGWKYTQSSIFKNERN